MADSSSLLQSRAAARGAKSRIARASSTDLPRMWSQTRRALRADERTYLAWARTTGGATSGSEAPRPVRVRADAPREPPRAARRPDAARRVVAGASDVPALGR